MSDFSASIARCLPRGGLLPYEWRALDACDRGPAAVWSGLLRLHDESVGINDTARLRRGRAFDECLLR